MNLLLHIRFEMQAAQTPDAVAVVANGYNLTFADLNGRSNQLAHLLQQQGVGLESIVAVYLERSAEMIIALLAVLKAGAAYLPIDPNYPKERIAWMLTDAETAVCLSHSSLKEKLPKEIQAKTIFIDQSDTILSLQSPQNSQTFVQPGNLAYIIYTSGSTGKPKGAMICHGGLANYLDWALTAYPMQAGGAPVHSSIGFDLTVTSLFLPLLAGKPVRILPEGDGGMLLANALVEHGKFGLVKITPAHLQLLNQMVPAEKAAAATQSFVIGGEQLTTEQLAFWRKQAPNIRLFNEYGPTETVVGCCVFEVLPENHLRGAIPIGKPIANTQLYLLDEQMQLVPQGEAGELYIGGAGVARGYLQRPSLTAEKFVPDPFGSVPGARLYRTGDLARMRSDGNLEFLGRIDHQVKIRGYRIELGEIEAALAQHKHVRETAVIVQETSHNKRLVAYFVAQQMPSPTTADLRDFLTKTLPDYMIPAQFVRLEAMPLTINGKIDRQQLPAPESVRPDLRQPYAPPRTPNEGKLTQIWAEVLGFTPVGIHDDFFALGGDSILAIQIVAKAGAAGFNFSQMQLFQQPTVAALAAAVSTKPLPAQEPVTQRPYFSETDQRHLRQQFGDNFDTAYPLSPLQEGILFHTLLHPEDDLYFEQPAFTLEGKLDTAVLQKAWRQVVLRHPILRSVFAWEGLERPLQIVLKTAPPRCKLLDWRHLSPAEQTAQMDAFLAINRKIGLPLAVQPPHHLALIRLTNEQTRFIWTVHHIINDGWSEGLLHKELFAIYEALLHGETAVLPPAEPFETFIRWQQAHNWQQAQDFWQQTLAGFALPTPLTVDKHGRLPSHQHQEDGEQRFQLAPELLASLHTFCRQRRLTLGTLLQAAWGLLLSRYSGEKDVVFGTMMSGRSPHLPGVETMAGVLINPVPLRVQIEPETAVWLWLQQFQDRLLAVQPFETTPLPQVQKWSELPADQPLFESLLVLENYPRQRHAAGSQLVMRDYYSYERTNYPLTIRILPQADMTAVFVYDRNRFEETAVQRMFDHWCNLLAGMVVDGERPLADLPLLSPAEAQDYLLNWGGGTAVFPATSCIHHQFERQAAQTPQAIALKMGNDQLTYDELNSKANQLAHFLLQKGIQPDDLVALYLNRSLEMVVAILGVLKAGGAYLPMDTVYPPERLAFMLQDSQASVVLTINDLRLTISSLQSPASNPHSPIPIILCLDSDWSHIANQPTTNPVTSIQPHNRAYVIYTSGSTGKPKGVLVTHRNVMRLFSATDDWFHFGQDDVWTLFHSYAFDFSVWEIWGALLYGGRLLIIPYLISRSPQEFYHLLLSEKVTVLNQTPSAFRQLMQAEAALSPVISGQKSVGLALRLVIFGGEALELHSLQPWFERHGDQQPQLVNMYGITETTVHVTYRPLQNEDVLQASGSVIGRPIPDLQLFILDEQQRPLPIGVPGEIYVAGAGVTAGYLNRPELTAERFVLLPQFSSKGGKVYRTGDLARWLPDGDIEYLGRIDQQVKIRGFRIELGEIEAALAGHTAVRELLVLVREDRPNEKRLVAYLVLDSAQGVTVSDLRRYLQPKLPAYMIPAAFVLLEAFPLTANGKIDRRALPAPDEVWPQSQRPYSPPRSAAEEALCAIWSRVLNVTQVGIEDNYFELGGDSIRSIQLLAQAKQAGFDFSLAQLFDRQTIAALMAVMPPQETAVSPNKIAPFSLISAADRAKLPPTVVDAYPLSKLQAGMLFHTELEAETAVYHNVTSWHIQARFDETALQTAVQQLGQRHPVLRSSFNLSSFSEPIQLVWPQAQIPIHLHDCCHLAKNEQEAAIGRLVEQAASQKFNWGTPPLLRFDIVRRSENSWQIILAEHHVILDGWSVASLLAELLKNAHALHNGQLLPLVDGMPYREFVAAEQAALASEAARAFWQDALVEHSKTALPRLPLPNNDQDLPETAVQQTIISQKQVSQLNQVAQQAGVPLKSVFLAAHLKLLGFVCGQNDVLTGLVMNGRPEQSGSVQALGLFLNTVPFRQKLMAGSWFDLIRQTFATEKALLPYRRFPLAEIQQMMDEQPLFEIPFNFIHFHVLHDLPAEIVVLDEQFFGHANFPLAVEAELNSGDGSLVLRLEYKPAEFDVTRIQSLIGYFERILAAIAADPLLLHQQFSPLSEAERQQLLFDWNAAAAPLPNLLIHEWVAQIAEEMPKKTAVSFQNQQLTYAHLNQKANQLAHYLQANGVETETLVAVYLNRSPEMVIAALGILKAGGAYLPLDPSYPAERLQFMLQDASADFVLTSDDLRVTIDDLQLEGEPLPSDMNDLQLAGEAWRSGIQSPASSLICLDSDWPQIAQYSSNNPSSDVTSDNAAYIIYTSGSTGQPKGVVVTHRGIPNMAQAKHKQFAIDSNSRVLQFAAFGFDASVSEMFVTFTAGATLVLASAEALMPGPDLAHLVASERVTAVTLPPSALAMMNPGDFPSLQTVVAAGEACSAEVVARWARGRRFVNGYGPTEATVCATTAVLTPADATIHIGRPIDNVQLFILNADRQLVPVGTPGELYIGGIGVARGYLNRPELTAERFVDLQFLIDDLGFNRQSKIVNRKFYKSGDLVRYLPGGNIEFLGRLDHQVKLRGYRIELGEIEAALRQQTAVQDALVIARDDAGAALQLVAYVVGQNLVTTDLRDAVSQQLPSYMVPAAFVSLDAFPLTPNGKIDRRALPAPAETAAFHYVPPRSDVETVIATLWAELLKLPRVGIDDNFFELGGNSLLATQLVVRLRQTLRIDLSLRSLFNAPTVAKITDVVLQPPNNRARVEKVAQLLIKLSQLSDEDAAQMLSQKR